MHVIYTLMQECMFMSMSVCSSGKPTGQHHDNNNIIIEHINTL